MSWKISAVVLAILALAMSLNIYTTVTAIPTPTECEYSPEIQCECRESGGRYQQRCCLIDGTFDHWTQCASNTVGCKEAEDRGPFNYSGEVCDTPRRGVLLMQGTADMALP